MLAAPLLALVVAIGLTSTAAGSPKAHAARACTPPPYPGGTANGYFSSLSVSGTTCAQGKKVALAFYKCRTKKGKSGHCTKKVLKYSCHESSRVTSPIQFIAKVTCTRGHRKVVHKYSQNL